MQCPDRRRLTLLLEDGLTPDEESSIERHVRACTPCLSALEALSETSPAPDPLAETPTQVDVSPRATDETMGPLVDVLRKIRGPAADAPRLAERGDGGPGRDAEARPLPTIPGYEVLERIGHGGMGIVYKARHIGLKRVVALKTILAGPHADEAHLSRFRVEAEAVARLRHPNVVQVHALGEADGLPYLELEYLPAGSLDARLDGTPWPADRAAALMLQLARAVAHVHALGIVHRDLKPANVLLAADGTPKVSDFGLAKTAESELGLTRTDSILGSPSYMAPEQAERRPGVEVGPAADIYALGAILYVLLVGRPPFRAATVLQTLEQVRTTDPVPPSRLNPGLPRDLETVALKCLQKDPARRYRSADELAEEFRRFSEGLPTVARPPGRAERVWAWCRGKPVLAAAAALAVAAHLGLFAATQAANRDLTREVARLRAERDDLIRALDEARRRADRARGEAPPPHADTRAER